MAEIQAALSAKFMHAAGAHKAGHKEATTAQEGSLASFFGVLKSQLAKQDAPDDALVSILQGESVLKSEGVLEEEPSALLSASSDLPAWATDSHDTALQASAAVVVATTQAAATPAVAVAAIGFNRSPESSEDSLPADAGTDLLLTGATADTGEKSSTSAKSEGVGKLGGAAIAAVAGQGLPSGKASQQAEASLSAVAVQTEATADSQISPALLPLQGARVDVATNSGNTAPITLAHPFDQVLRQAEVKINAAIEAPVRSPAFAAELSDKVVWLATRQGQFADLSLNPPQMGSLEVRLTLSGTGDASAQFFSANPAVREALDAALPRLRELMAQAGINLGEAAVREHAFGRRERSETQGQNLDQEGEIVAHPATMAGINLARSGGSGLVDLYI